MMKDLVEYTARCIATILDHSCFGGLAHISRLTSKSPLVHISQYSLERLPRLRGLRMKGQRVECVNNRVEFGSCPFQERVPMFRL